MCSRTVRVSPIESVRVPRGDDYGRHFGFHFAGRFRLRHFHRISVHLDRSGRRNRFRSGVRSSRRGRGLLLRQEASLGHRNRRLRFGCRYVRHCTAHHVAAGTVRMAWNHSYAGNYLFFRFIWLRCWQTTWAVTLNANQARCGWRQSNFCVYFCFFLYCPWLHHPRALVRPHIELCRVRIVIPSLGACQEQTAEEECRSSGRRWYAANGQDQTRTRRKLAPIRSCGK